MNKEDILKSNYLDLLFDGKNKQYGAYKIRKSYPKRIMISLLIALVIFGTLITLASNSSESKEVTKIISDTTTVIIVPPSEKKIIKPEKTEKIVKSKPVDVTKETSPLFINKELIRDKDRFTDLNQVINVGSETVVGEKTEVSISIPVITKDTGKVITSVETPKKDKTIYTKVEIEASFKNFKDFLVKNLKYPDEAQENEQQGIVIIEFVVDKNGNISNIILADSSPCKVESLVSEAIRIIKKSSGKWLPGIQNGIPVKSYHKQSINFILVTE